MRTSTLLLLAACLVCSTAARALESGERQARDYDWARDPRSLSPTTKGLEGLLPSTSASGKTAIFGDLLGEWSWSEMYIPGGGGSPAGISYSQTYLFLCDQTLERVYVVDISTGEPETTVVWFMAPCAMPWGAGMDNEPEFWVGSVSPSYGGDGNNYEYDISSLPSPPSQTGNSFYNVQESNWMADISENFPADTIWQLRVGTGAATNSFYAFHEPSGTVGRSISHPSWAYTSQRALTYNPDNQSFVVGGWNSAAIWEVSPISGEPIIDRKIDLGGVAGIAYQPASSGGPCLWVQDSGDMLRKFDFPVLPADDIGVLTILEPYFPFIDPSPFAVTARLANRGTEEQNFSTWVEVAYDTVTWTSEVVPALLAPLELAEVTYEEFPNGEGVGTVFDVCVHVQNPGDEDESNDSVCTTLRIPRACFPYVTDDYEFGNGIYFNDTSSVYAKEMRTAKLAPASLAWAAVNTVSKGEPFYPWPDPTYDPIEISAWIDNDLNGAPDDTGGPAWADTVTPGDDHWAYAEVPGCSFSGRGGRVWVGYRNLNAGREGMVVDETREYTDTWHYNGGYWMRNTSYGDWHIRGCLEYPLIAKPKTPDPVALGVETRQGEIVLELCGTIHGELIISDLIAADGNSTIEASFIDLSPSHVENEGGNDLALSVSVLCQVELSDSTYFGTLFLTHDEGLEEIPVTVVLSQEKREPRFTFYLSRNHPNPVSDRTSIRYTIAEASDVSIGVYNSAGMLVKNLVNEYRAPGVYTVNWDNVDMSNGVYFYRMNAGDFSMTQKMVVMK